MLIKKQLKALRQIAVISFDKDPAHFTALINEIDDALSRIANEEIDALEFDEVG